MKPARWPALFEGRGLTERPRCYNPLMTPSQLRGAVYGLLVGDALGVPYEFHGPGALPPRDALELAPPPGFDRAHRDVPPGTWSDDGAQALCLLESLLACGRLEVDDLGRRLVAWHDDGHGPRGQALCEPLIASLCGRARDAAQR